MLPNFKSPRIADQKYLRSMKDRPCAACGAEDGTVVGAHMRWHEFSGMGRKPDDALVVPLCFECHADQEANPGPEWWAQNVLKPMLRQRYQDWAEHGDG